jgi:chromosomal replication initiator protein
MKILREIKQVHYWIAPGINKSKALDKHSIADIICKELGVSMLEVEGTCRVRPIVFCRHAICYFVHQHMPGITLEAIGQLIGGKDHATVLHAIKAIQNRIDTEPDVHDQLLRVNVKIMTAIQQDGATD